MKGREGRKQEGKEGGEEGGREGRRKGGREQGWEGWREGGKEEKREGGREEGLEAGMEGGREGGCCLCEQIPSLDWPTCLVGSCPRNYLIFLAVCTFSYLFVFLLLKVTN